MKDGYSIIDRASFGMVVVFDYEIYAVPVSIARVDDKLYFKSKNSGRKVDVFENEHYVKVIFVEDVRTPDYDIEDVKSRLESDRSILMDEVFTQEYSSAIVDGFIEKALSDDRNTGIDALLKKYNEDAISLRDEFIKEMDDYNIYRIDITNISTKVKKIEGR